MIVSVDIIYTVRVLYLGHTQLCMSMCNANNNNGEPLHACACIVTSSSPTHAWCTYVQISLICTDMADLKHTIIVILTCMVT